jgi:hypothetical protein
MSAAKAESSHESVAVHEVTFMLVHVSVTPGSVPAMTDAGVAVKTSVGAAPVTMQLGNASAGLSTPSVHVTVSCPDVHVCHSAPSRRNGPDPTFRSRAMRR